MGVRLTYITTSANLHTAETAPDGEYTVEWQNVVNNRFDVNTACIV